MRLATLSVLLVTTASAMADGAPAPAPTTASAKNAAPHTGAARPEDTAGVYWVPYATCYDCERPEAIVAYVVQTPAAAKQIARGLEGKLPLGLPYIIHTDELGLSQRGIAVVTGSFSTLAAAKAAEAKTPKLAKTSAKAIALASDEHGYPANVPEAPRHVTVVDRGAPVPAWSKADVDRAQKALWESEDPDAQNTRESQHQWLRREVAKRKPACTVQPGDVFVVEDKDLEHYEFAPVKCGGKLAYIEWTQSLLGHAVIVNRGGTYRLHQVVGAQCDSPIIEEWDYDRTGRHRIEKKPGLLAMGGC